jgi:four helix bundle suffix protein
MEQERDNPGLMPVHGGYRHLKSFQVAQLVYDVTVRFCERYVEHRSRTRDQMVQAARSGVQNIAEGSQASGTSKKTEIKLTNVARASLEELRLDYEDFLRQRRLALWPREDPRRAELIGRRPANADAVARWARDVRTWQGGGPGGRCGVGGREARGPGSLSSTRSTSSTEPTASTYAEISANGALALIAVACSLLSRQLASLERAFVEQGGFTERLYRVRSARRGFHPR